jgi:hypothetical protein
LNVTSRADADTKGATNADEKADEKALEEEHGSAELPYVDGEGPFVVPDPDLDPIALDTAFRFAAWSSVLLVCNLDFPSFWTRC